MNKITRNYIKNKICGICQRKSENKLNHNKKTRKTKFYIRDEFRER